jgi:hypothetical protein
MFGKVRRVNTADVTGIDLSPVGLVGLHRRSILLNGEDTGSSRVLEPGADPADAGEQIDESESRLGRRQSVPERRRDIVVNSRGRHHDQVTRTTKTTQLAGALSR